MDRASLINDLHKMGLHSTDTVLLHTSMKAIGPVHGGTETVLAALEAFFEPGLLCFPALSWNTIKADPPAFDVLNTPSIVGVLPEMFRRRPGVLRSWNPTHSMCAKGRDAAAFVSEDHLSGTPCGPRSSWRKLVTRDAWILMVGCDLTSCTFLHGVEEWCGIPGRIGQPALFRVTTPDGSTLQLSSAAHSSSPSVHYWRLEEGLFRAGLAARGTFGQADTLVLRARDLYSYATGRLHADPTLFDDKA